MNKTFAATEPTSDRSLETAEVPKPEAIMLPEPADSAPEGETGNWAARRDLGSTANLTRKFSE